MRRAAAIGLITLASLGSGAFAGPPYITDDPEPTDPQHWEIYAFGTGTKTTGTFAGAAGLDVNYGALPGLQLTATIPVAFEHDRRTHTGFGDLEIAAKYRFISAERAGFDLALFPRLILPTANKRFGSGKTGLLLPVWAQKDIGPWSIFGGGGYMINPGAGNRDFWQTGIAVSRTISPHLSLGAEIAHQGADAIDAKNYTALNFGGIYQLGGPFEILFSAGPGVSHVRDGGKYNVYIALGMVF